MSHLLLAFGSTGSWVVELPGSAVTAPMEIRISVLLLWLFADSSHSGQKPCQPWGCPDCSKKQMEGLTSPAPLHPLQDWSSNWAHVKTRRRAITSRLCKKHIEHIEFLHRNKSWVHNSWKIIQSVLLLLNAQFSFSHSLTNRIGSPDAPSDTQYWISTSRKSDSQEPYLEFAEQEKWASYPKTFLCNFQGSWAVLLTALLKLMILQMKQSFSIIFIYQPPDF